MTMLNNQMVYIYIYISIYLLFTYPNPMTHGDFMYFFPSMVFTTNAILE